MRGAKKINSVLDRTLGISVNRSKSLKAINERPVGMVEIFSRDKVIGWVSARPNDFPIKVDLCVNGLPVTSTWAEVEIKRTTKGEVKSFFFATRDIWEYCSRKNRLTVEVNGQILPMYEKGVYRRPGKNGTKSLNDLKQLFKEGYIFDNYGNLQLSKKLDREWQLKIIDMYDDVSKVLKGEHNTEPFLIYGSLLGQVREGGFIGHDGDFDIAYLSKHKSKNKIIDELSQIAHSLIDAGYDIKQNPTSIHIHHSDDYSLKIDLFHLFFDKNNLLQFPFGVAGSSDYSKNEWRGLKDATFSGFPVKIPVDAENLVAHIYGNSWRIPIAGFNWQHARTACAKNERMPENDRVKINKANRQSRKLKIINEFGLKDFDDSQNAAEFVIEILHNQSTEALRYFDILSSQDQKIITKVINDAVLLDKNKEWTSHGIAKTFRFWSKAEKKDYINHTLKLINDLESLSKDVCLGFGSVLATIRDNDLIPHDDDMDIILAFRSSQAATLPEARTIIAKHLKKLGYSLEGDNFAHWQVISASYKIDVFVGIYDKDGSIGWYPGPRDALKRSDIFPVKTHKLLDVQCPVPKRANKYLSVVFGEDWRSPQPGFRHVWNQTEYKDLS